MWLKFILFYFIFTYLRVAKMFIKNKKQLKWEKYVCVNFSMLAGPFNQTRVGGGGEGPGEALCRGLSLLWMSAYVESKKTTNEEIKRLHLIICNLFFSLWLVSLTWLIILAFVLAQKLCSTCWLFNPLNLWPVLLMFNNCNLRS